MLDAGNKKHIKTWQLDFNEHLLTGQNCQNSETPESLEDLVEDEETSESRSAQSINNLSNKCVETGGGRMFI